MKPNFKTEKKLFEQGYNLIAGVDEVGRGSLAGPIVAAGIIMDPKKPMIRDVRDSKLLDHKKRVKLREEIYKRALCWGIGDISHLIIDKYGLTAANKLALKSAIANLKVQPDYVLIDFVTLTELEIPSESIVKGDAKIYSIACASIIAKVYRDELMIAASQNYPEYKFHSNKGYLTKFHLEAICEHGFCDLHRQSFWPVSAILET